MNPFPTLWATALATGALTLVTIGCSGDIDGTVGPGHPGASATGTTSVTGAGGASTSTTTGAQAGGSSTTGGMPPGGMMPPPPAGCGRDSTASVDGAPPAAFVTYCSSCHGPTASGKGGYPSLRSGLVLGQFFGTIRAGKVSAALMVTTAEGKTIPARMPSFSTTRLTDVEANAIYQYVSKPLDPAVKPAPYCLARPEAGWTPAEIDQAYQRGVKAWRTPGSVDQNACVFCHGPDAMEFAAIGYTDSQIYRRAFTHTDQPTADDVIDMVHALRARYNIAEPPDPILARPFQPGGQPLAGNSALERDKVFGAELQKMGLRLMGAPINSAADARQAWQELLGINLRKLQVGIPFNRYTEDKYNNDGASPACPDVHQCDDHGTIADWISDVPVLTAATAAKLFPLHDAYLADPTLENLKAILHAAPRDDTMWFKNKYLSVQMANYLFRQQAGGMPLLDALPNAPFAIDKGTIINAIWMVGANLRDFVHNVGAALPTGGGKFSVPTQTLPGLTRNSAVEQLHRVIVPWFWLGFTFDPSTLNSQADYVAEGDEYFTQETFLDDPYPIHGAFIVSKRTVEVMAQPMLPRTPNVFPFFHPDLGRFPVTPMTMRSGYFPEVVNFAEEKNFNTVNNYQLKYMPTEPAHKALYQTYTANMYRMFLWVLVDELQKTPEIWNPKILGGKIDKAEIFLKLSEVVAANGAADAAVIAQARDLVSKAKVNN